MNLLSILLQIQAAAPIVAAETPAQPEELTLISLIFKGGYLMIPIILLSIYAVYLFVERLLFINKIGKVDEALLDQIKYKITEGNIEEANALCRSTNNVIAKIYAKGLSRLGSPLRDIESVLENTANSEINKMEKNIGTLSAIAAIAPMIGFLGTVVGMIRSFYNIAITNDISIGNIAEGIYQKMVTSASGLLVGIVAYIFVTLLNNQISNAINKIEDNILSFLDLLYTPKIK